MNSRTIGSRAVALCALSFVAIACSDARVSRMTAHITSAELARARSAGFPARIVVQDAGDSISSGEQAETLLIVRPEGVRVLPAPAFVPFVRAGFSEWLLRVWVAPYLKVSDLDGAVRAATRGYTRALQDRGAMPPGAPLPPVPAPNEWGFTFPSENAEWGLPMSAMVFVLGTALEYFLRRRRVSGELAPASRRE